MDCKENLSFLKKLFYLPAPPLKKSEELRSSVDLKLLRD